MPISHLLLAVSVAVIWGANFLFVTFSLQDFSPLLLCALRFLLASVPAVFFIKLPDVPFRITVLYGLVMFALQFALLFMGLYIGMTPGLASLIMQVQVFFSLFFAVLFLGEQLTIWQVVGSVVSFLGIALVAVHLDQHITLLGLMCLLFAAAAWGVGNLITRKIKHVNMMALVVWGCFVACVPMFILSLLFEGPDRMVYAYRNLTWLSGLSLLYIVYASTWLGYGIWNWLLKRHPVGTVVPFTLLVPVVGVVTSIVVLGESFERWKMLAGLLVIAGLYLHLFGARLFAVKIQPAVPS